MKNSIRSIKLLIKEFPLILVVKIYGILSGIVKSLIPLYAINYITSTYYSNLEAETPVDVDVIIKNVIIIFAILVILLFVDYLISIYTNYVNRNFQARMAIKFYDKIGKIDYEFYENPEFLNDYVRSLEMGSMNIQQSAENTFALITILVQCASVLAVLLTIHYVIIIFIAVVGIIYFLIRLKMSKLNDEYYSKRQPYMRRTWYSNRAFTLRDSVADIKTTSIDELLLENNDNSYDEIIKYHDKIIKKRTSFAVICDILITLLYPGIVAILCIIAIDTLEVSSFATLTIAATTLSSFIGQLASVLGSLADNNVECRVAYKFLEKHGIIEEKDYKVFKDDFETLEIKDVSFSYDDKNKALNNISMKINKGEKIAIVGINGAGKTTLVKLLLRLYDVDSGDILINNQNYRLLNAKSLRKKVGAVFQNIEVYAITIAENILLHEIKTQKDIDLVHEALQFAGLYDYVCSLKDNINTLVTREFNKMGVVFSGGQIQKLAIARGYAQNYQLFILDEPSSALDPIAEAKIYENMLELGKNKTMIFISHRLTTTVNADKIYLFENGKIIEQGTHQELIALDGKYKRMFDSQAIKYLGGNYEE